MQKYFKTDENGKLYEVDEGQLDGVARKFVTMGAYVALTKAEINELKAQAAEDAKRKQEAADAKEARAGAEASARAKLGEIGLSGEEIDALISGLKSE